MADLPLTMPKMSMTMEEGTMVAWLKQVGDPVRSGEPICEVATDKVDMEVESPFDGVLARITAEPDEVVPVGEVIGYITTEADDLLGGLFDEPGAPDAAVADSAQPPAGQEPVADAGAPEAAAEEHYVRAVPRARSLAAEYGIDLHSVTPTGPWHTVRVSDVEALTGSIAVVEAPSAQPVAQPVVAAPQVPLTPAHAAPAVPAAASAPAAAPAPAVDPAEARRRRGRVQLAKVMSASALVPQFTAYADLDLRAAAAVRKTTLGGASWTVLLVRAQAIALRDVPALNAVWDGEKSVPNPAIGVALAVDSPTGLIAPVLRDPQDGSLADLVVAVKAAVEATRSGSVGLDLLSGGTTVFSNLGGFGVDVFNALLTPPHSTALSAGAVANRVFATDEGALGVRLQCTVGVTVDHRVADGADAARFLARVRELVASPDSLL